MSVNILGIDIAAFTMQQAVDYITDNVLKNKKTFIVTANAEILMLADSNPDFKAIIKSADLVLPDGAGVVLAARHLGYQMPERVAGYDLVQRLWPVAEQLKLKVFLFGAGPTIAQAAANEVQKNYPDIQIVGVQDGFFQPQQEEHIVSAINNSQADILLVALGVPKQEFFINKYKEKLNPKLLIGVGGTFDVMAGNVKRAPEFMQKNNLEWLYRLLSQPSRFGRMMALPKFVFKIIRQKH